MDNRDDELLGAYMDGELPADEAAALEQRLAEDTELQARLDGLLATNKATRQLFAEIDAQPMPEAVLNMLQQNPAKADNVVAIPKLDIARIWNLPVALAASVALVVGFLMFDMARQASAPITSMQVISANSIDFESALHHMLEEKGSGQVIDLGFDETGEAVLSFVDASGRYCRQLRVAGAESAAHAVVCRGNSAWQVEALAIADIAPDGQFQTANTEVPVDIISAVDTLIGDADPLGATEETQAISNSWQISE